MAEHTMMVKSHTSKRETRYEGTPVELFAFYAPLHGKAYAICLIGGSYWDADDGLDWPDVADRFGALDKERR